MPAGKRTGKSIRAKKIQDLGSYQGSPAFCGESFAHSNNSSLSPGLLRASLDTPNRIKSGSNGFIYPGWERFEQIYKGFMPFNMSSYGDYGEFLDCREMIELCQKAYFNVPIFRNTIDTMSEFSNSTVLFKGGNEKSRKFFNYWFYNKVGGYSLADQFFREWYRSGNVCLYRFDAEADIKMLADINKIYGADGEIKNPKSLPVKYLLINPSQLRAEYGLNFHNPTYHKVLSNAEMSRILHPISEHEKEFANSIGENFKKQMKENGRGMLYLSPDKTYTFFCKRQDYEPFAVPLFFPVLEDIDLKLIYKRMEKTISRTVELVQLKIAVGTEDDPNPLAIDALKELYRNETIGRVLIAPGPLDMEFIIPDLTKILGPEKYRQVNEDISQGLMGIFSQDEKYSGASIKVKIFMERLNEARQAFLSLFLNPEIKRISKELGFKNYPEAVMADLDLNDQTQTNKIYLQLLQLGALTPEETIEAIKTGYLPNTEESLESQKKYKVYRDEMLYSPLIGGGAVGQETGNNGRPTGTKSPQTTKKISPVGTSHASDEDLMTFNLNTLSENFKKANMLANTLEREAKKIFKVKKLNESQKNIISSLSPIIMVNEPVEMWESAAKEYIENPRGIKEEIGYEIDEISAKFDSSLFLSSLLYNSKK